MCAREKALIHIGLCETHRIQRKRFIAGGWLAALIGLAMLIAGISSYGGVMELSGFILLLIGAICGHVKGTVVSPAKIDKEFVWLKGAGPGFLAELNEWDGTR